MKTSRNFYVPALHRLFLHQSRWLSNKVYDGLETLKNLRKMLTTKISLVEFNENWIFITNESKYLSFRPLTYTFTNVYHL